MDQDGGTGTLHVVMLPWLAMGHLLPFFELSRRIAGKGHRVSFLTTHHNIRRLPENLSPHLLHLVELPFPTTHHLPDSVENSIDLPSDNLRPYLRIAFDTFEHRLSEFLLRTTDHPPDWIIYDYAAYWAPSVAAAHGVRSTYLSLFSAAALSFFGPGNRTSPEEFTVVPPWVPFPSTIAYRRFEARELFNPGVLPDQSGVSESYRFAKGMGDCPFMAIRSCAELESNWIELLSELYRKPVIPVGLFPPPAATVSNSEDLVQYRWLECQKPGSVVYAAFGSEAKLTVSQVREIAFGLELSGLPFVWVMREESSSAAPLLPEGFEERTLGRGVVCKGWVPQVRFLAHRSVGGFLTHGGWNSVVEGLTVGVFMVLLPLMFEQGLNARNLVEKGVAVEVERDEDDGSFTGEGIAKRLRFVLMEDGGEGLRCKARELKRVLGDEGLHDRYVGDFVNYLLDHRKQR